MLRTGSMIGTIQKRFCISNNRMDPKQVFCIGAEIFRDLGISFPQRLNIASKTVCFNRGSLGDVFCEEAPDRIPLYVLNNLHLEKARFSRFCF